MKKNLRSLLLFAGILIAGCSSENNPRPVAEKFLNAMQKRDYTEASKYAGKETIKLLHQLEKVEELNKEIEPVEKPGKISIISDEIRGNHATVYFMESGNDLQQKISLEKVEIVDPNGKKSKEWKVDLRKEEIRLNHEPGEESPADSMPSKIPV
jgi:hypothetical protein